MMEGKKKVSGVKLNLWVKFVVAEELVAEPEEFGGGQAFCQAIR